MLPHLLLLPVLLHLAAAFRLTQLNLPPPTRSGSCTISTATAHRKLLQSNGTADDFVHFTFCPNQLRSAALLDYSSDAQVLLVEQDTADVELDRIETAHACQNVTASFSFDRMVGTTVYTLAAVNESDTLQTLCAAQVQFVIVGFSVYEDRSSSQLALSVEEKATTSNAVVSGVEREIISDYRQTLAQSVRTFKVKVQFPDGSTSETRSPSSLADELRQVTIDASFDLTSPIQFISSSCHPLRSLQRNNPSLPSEHCGTSLTVIDSGETSHISCALQYVPYKDGTSTLVFRWPDLTGTDPQLEGEEYSNVMFVSVLGDPPPIVQDFTPKKVFHRSGGENITLVMDNTEGSISRVLRVADQTFPEVPESYHKRDDGLFEAKYVTQSGNGTELEWKLFVSFAEGTSKLAVVSGVGFTEASLSEFMSYDTTPVEVRDVVPAYGREGDVVQLFGFFDGFNISTEGHELFLGSKALSDLGVTVSMSDSRDEISFQVPERKRIGTFFEFPIIVVVGNESSPPVMFTYKPEILDLKVDVYGASYNRESDEYDLGGCAISRYIASVPSGVSEPEQCSWGLYDATSPERKDLLQGYSENSVHMSNLILFPQVFGGREGRFSVFVSCSVSGEDLEGSVFVRKTLSPRIGTKLLELKSRSVSIPDVPLRVSAIISPPREQCYNRSSRIIYRWTYQNVSEEFSYRNWSTASVNSLSTPARLGREFIIPQRNIQPGNLTVSLLAYMEDEPSVSGEATATVTIDYAPLVPVIGYGAARILHSVSMNLNMTGENSYSPDDKYLGNNSRVANYRWTCKILQTLSNTSSFMDCDKQFLPEKHASSFIVPKEALLRIRDTLYPTNTKSPYYVQYKLSVESTRLMSTSTQQLVEVSPESFEVAQLQDLKVMDNRGDEIDQDKLQYFEDILISPVGEDVVWKFSIISPKSSLLLLKEPGNLILHPGYFDPSIPNMKQGLPLGVRSWTFQSSQQYELLIPLLSSRPGVEPGEARIVLRTEDRPSLILPNLPVLFGDSETVFSAFARVNVDSSHEFQYFFYLIRSDGDEYCLDGCGGSPYVQFRLSEAGSFRIHVRLMDMRGKTIFDEASFPQNISVSSETFEVNALSSDTRLGDFDAILRIVHEQGDHGTFELLSSSLASRVKSEGVHLSSDIDMKVLDLAIGAMLQIVQNSAPTTMTSKSYVKTASRFAGLSSEYFATPETLYAMLSMVDKAVRNVPPTEAFDMQEELLEFYNLSSRHITHGFPESSTRVRLLQFGPSTGLDAGSLLIDMHLLFEDHLTMVLSRDAQCGMVKHLNTVVENGARAKNANGNIIEGRKTRSGQREDSNTFGILGSYESINKNPAHSAFTLAVVCNPDQARGIRGEASTFTWCNKIFAQAGDNEKSALFKVDPNQKRLFTLLETVDFLTLSGKSNDELQTDTKFLVGVNVTVAASDDATEDPHLRGIANCYSVNTSMTRLGITPSKGCLSVEGFRVQELSEPFEPKIPSESMRVDFSSVTANISTDGSSTVLITASNPGLFGAVGKDCPINAQKPNLALPGAEDKAFVYFLFGGMTAALVGVGATWVATSTAYVSTATAAVA